MDKVKDLAGAFKADELITIALEDGGIFTVQKALLRHCSPYFASALDGGFQETETKQLKVPGCSTDAFELLLYWMCTSTLPKSFNNTDTTGDWEASRAQVQMELVRLWAVADLLMLRKLKNIVMLRLNTILSGQIISTETVQLAIEMTSTDSGIGGYALSRFYADRFNYPKLYSESQLEKLGKVPGIFSAFANKVNTHVMNGHIDGGDLDGYIFPPDEDL